MHRHDPSEPPAIVLDQVSKSFGAHTVLDGVSLTVRRGSIMVMLGPSGTGKSVLLRCLVGLLRPDAGRVLVFGDDVAALDDQRPRERERLFQIRRRFGMLFQDGALFDDMNVGDNVAFPMRMHTRKGEVTITADEQPANARPEKIPTLKPAFRKDGTVTAANASSISDGAAALVLATRARAEAMCRKAASCTLPATFAIAENGGFIRTTEGTAAVSRWS